MNQLASEKDEEIKKLEEQIESMKMQYSRMAKDEKSFEIEPEITDPKHKPPCIIV